MNQQLTDYNINQKLQGNNSGEIWETFEKLKKILYCSVGFFSIVLRFTGRGHVYKSYAATKRLNVSR